MNEKKNIGGNSKIRDIKLSVLKIRNIFAMHFRAFD